MHIYTKYRCFTRGLNVNSGVKSGVKKLRYRCYGIEAQWNTRQPLRSKLGQQVNGEVVDKQFKNGISWECNRGM